MINPRDVKQADYPSNGTFEQKVLFLLNYAVLAPSNRNTQPWIFELTQNTIKLFADTSRALQISDISNRELVISCGAAIGNLEVAANYFGLTCSFDYFPDKNNKAHLVNVSLIEGHAVTAIDRRSFSVIKDRATTRKPLKPYQLPESLTEYLNKQAEEYEIELKLIVDQELRRNIAGLTSDADREHFSDPEFRRELSEWIRSTNNQQHDGITLSNKWTPGFLAKMESMIIKGFDIGDGMAARVKELTEESPTLVVIATDSEAPLQWFVTGIFLSRILLHLAASGISVGYLNQAVEIADIRDLLRKEAGIAGYPQLLLRIGKGEMSGHSARRPIADVVR